MKKMVLSGVGRDKSGIVSTLTKVLFEAGCNVEDTSMTQLEDHFSVLMIFESNLSVAELESALGSVTQGIHFQCSLYEIDTASETVGSSGAPWTLSVSCKDQVGVMHHVTQYLASKQVNITHLSSKRITQKETEEPLFLMVIELEVPESLSEDVFQADLADIGAAQQLEIRAEPLEVYVL